MSETDAELELKVKDTARGVLNFFILDSRRVFSPAKTHLKSRFCAILKRGSDVIIWFTGARSCCWPSLHTRIHTLRITAAAG